MSEARQRPACAPEPLLLKPKDAAQLLQIGARRLWLLTNTKVIPHVRVGRSLRYPLAALKEWLAAQTEGGH